MELKIGDKVVIRSDLIKCRSFSKVLITDTMVKIYAGQEVVITKVLQTCSDIGPRYIVKLTHKTDHNIFTWSQELFTVPSSNLISIY